MRAKTMWTKYAERKQFHLFGKLFLIVEKYHFLCWVVTVFF